MPLTGTERLRSLIGDMRKAAIQEDVARGDGATTDFQLDMFPVQTASLSVFNTGTLVSATVSLGLGTFSLTGSAPAAGNVILATYNYFALAEDECQSIIDSVSGIAGDRLLLAAAIGCRAIAANYARFFAYTQGSKSVDKNQQAKKLMDLAESYEKAYQNSVTIGSPTTITVATFDDSGTAFDEYDTATAFINEDS